MLKLFQKRDVLVRVFLGLVMGIIGITMVITLAPGPVGSLAESTTAVADVGGQRVSIADVQREMQRLERGQQIPSQLRPFYARQVIDRLLFARMLEVEAGRLGIRVTDEERAQRIKLIIPSAFVGETFVGMERYSAEVEQRLQMSVTEFEELVRQGLLEEKFRTLLTDGASATPEEIEQEFRRKNEKVKLEYVLLKPEELQAQVPTLENEISVYYEKNKVRYQIPERRTARYILLDPGELRQRVSVSDAELRAFYDRNIARYRVQNRAQVAHILFRSVGKTEAEVEEIRKKAEDVLKQARKPGAKFDESAKKYSEDDVTKTKGGDLGWIVRSQTVPEFEQAAFTLPKGAISDLIKTQYGFHIIKVFDRESERTRSFDEVRGEILPILTAEKVQQLVEKESTRLADEVRKSTRQPLDEIARKFSLAVKETAPIAAADPATELGPGREFIEALFRLRKDDLGGPLRLESGTVVYTLKDVQPGHQGALAEVRDRVVEDYRREKSADLARTRAEDLARRAQSAGSLAPAAKALSLEMKASELVSRADSVPDIGPLKPVAAAFTMPVGSVSGAINLGARWVVFRVAERQDPKMEELVVQRKSIEGQILQSKRQLAFESFREELERRLRAEGKLLINDENYKRLTTPTL